MNLFRRLFSRGKKPLRIIDLVEMRITQEKRFLRMLESSHDHRRAVIAKHQRRGHEVKGKLRSSVFFTP